MSSRRPAAASGGLCLSTDESVTVVFANVLISLREMKAHLAERDEYVY
jgi:hypothetical protein